MLLRKYLPFLLLLAVIASTLTAQEQPGKEGFIEWKKKQVQIVVDELRCRDISHLPAELKKSRTRHLVELETYGKEGIFPIHSQLGLTWKPYFIGPFGNRCAMANIIEKDGQSELLQRLSKVSNNFYISQLEEDVELMTWIKTSGLSLEEVAYIHGPSFFNNGLTAAQIAQQLAIQQKAIQRAQAAAQLAAKRAQRRAEIRARRAARRAAREARNLIAAAVARAEANKANSLKNGIGKSDNQAKAQDGIGRTSGDSKTDSKISDGKDASTDQAGDADRSFDFNSENTPRTGTSKFSNTGSLSKNKAITSKVPNVGSFAPGLATVSSPGAIPANAGGYGGGKKKSSSQTNWMAWWTNNRDDFVDIRSRYHGNPSGTTPNTTGGTMNESPNRPTALDRKIFITQGLSKLAKNPAFTIAVLNARAESVEAKNAPSLVSELLTSLKTKKVEHREYGLLGLGLTRCSEGRAALKEVVMDTSKGRRLLARSNRVPDRTRALAAYGLGLDGDVSSRELFLKILEEGGGVQADLQAACVMALGLVDKANNTSVSTPFLAAMVNDKSRDLRVRSQAPAALALCGNRAALPTLLDPIKKVKGPAEIRRACALALGSIATGLEADVVRILMMSAKRDPDPNVREFAVATIGKLGWRDFDRGAEESKERRALLNEVAKFLDDGVTGSFKQPIDQPWYALAAGLFVESHPSYSAEIGKNLVNLAMDGKWVEARSAAAIGLALSGNKVHSEDLRDQLELEKSPMTRGFLAESLGILGDKQSGELCRDLALDSHSQFLRYQGATALASMGDVRIAPWLVKNLANSSSEAVRAGLTGALGRIGDRRSMAGLFELANNTKMSQPIRLRAISALAIIGRTTDTPWSQSIRSNINPSVSTRTLREISRMF